MANIKKIQSFIESQLDIEVLGPDFFQAEILINTLGDTQTISIGVAENLIWMSAIFAEVNDFPAKSVLKAAAEHTIGVALLDDFYATSMTVHIPEGMNLKDWANIEDNPFFWSALHVANTAFRISQALS